MKVSGVMVPPIDFKAGLIAALKDDEVAELLKERVFGPIVREAVAALCAKKDEEINALKEEVSKLSEQVNDLEQYSRRQCLNFSGIPEQQNENTDKLVMEVAKAAGVTVKPDDIDVSHRIGRPKTGKPRTIIVRFQNFAKRQEVYGARRELRDARAPRRTSLTPAILSATFIAENLTQKNELLMYKARQAKREGRIHAAWTDLGKVKIRREQGDRTHIVKTEDDLARLTGGAPGRAPAPVTSAGAGSAGPAAAVSG